MFDWLKTNLKYYAIFTMAVLASACGNPDVPAYQPSLSQNNPLTLPEYRFAIVPEGSQARVPEVYGPLVAYLNAHLKSARLALVAPKNHADLEEDLSNKVYDLSLTNALQTIRALEHGYHVIAKKADDDLTYGLILVRRDGGINTVSDLKGKKVCYPSPTGVAATILPKQFLKSQGLDVNRDIDPIYVGSHESSLLHVYSGKASACTVRDFSWQAFQKNHPKEAFALEVKWQTASFIDQAIIMRNDVPKELADQIRLLLIGLHETPEGRAILAEMNATKFVTASNASYDKARKFFAENSDLIVHGKISEPSNRSAP